jgi:hypothetical protein
VLHHSEIAKRAVILNSVIHRLCGAPRADSGF